MESRYVLHIKQGQTGRTDDFSPNHLDGTVANLKERIRDLVGVPVDQQHLFESGFIHGSVLEDHHSLYMFRNNSVINLELGCFISLETRHGNFLYQDDGSETVENLKTKLYSHLQCIHNYPVDQQIVFFGNQVLDDQRTLSSHGVQNKSVLNIEFNNYDCCVIITTSAKKPTILPLDNLSRTVEYIKTAICAVTAYPVYQVNLIFRDQILEDKRSLSSYGIQHRSTIHLELRSHLVLIETFCQGPTAVYLDNLSGTVEDLKAAIFKQEGYPRENQKLIFRGQTLGDRATLSSSGVRNGSSIQLELNQCVVLLKAAIGRPNFIQDNLSETVEGLKRKIHALTGYPVNQQKLIFRDKVLDDELRSLSSYGIRNDSAIHLRGGLRVHIKTSTNKRFDVRLDSLDETVWTLKAKIHDHKGIPAEKQTLIANSKQLEDNHTLSYYGIQSDCTIHLITILRAGGFPPSPDRAIRLTDYARQPTTSPEDRQGDTRRSTQSLQIFGNFRCTIS